MQSVPLPTNPVLPPNANPTQIAMIRQWSVMTAYACLWGALPIAHLTMIATQSQSVTLANVYLTNGVLM